jgi:hypothetical protein
MLQLSFSGGQAQVGGGNQGDDQGDDDGGDGGGDG